MRNYNPRQPAVFDCGHRFANFFSGWGSFDLRTMDDFPDRKTLLKASTLRRVWQLLTPVERRKSVGLLAVLALNSLVDLLGLAAVLPVLTTVLQPELLHTTPFFLKGLPYAAAVGIDSHAELLLALAVGMVAAFVFKAVFGLAVTTILARFAFNVAHRMSGDQWNRHFDATRNGRLEADMGQVLAEVNAWPFLFANTFLAGGLLAVSEAVTAGLIAAVVFAFSPVVFVVVAGLLGVGTFLVRTATRKRLAHFSNLRNRAEPASNAWISDALRGYMEMLTFRAGEAMRSAYLRERLVVLDTAAATSVVAILPAKVYEVLAVAALAGAIALSLALDSTSAEFLAVLSLLALSAYRVMPSLSRISGALLAMRGHAYVLHAMEQAALERPAGIDSSPEGVRLRGGIELELAGVSLCYGKGQGTFLEGLQARFEPGRLHAVVGPSGSGKSTLLRTLLGLHAPTSGKVHVRTEEGVWTLGETIATADWLGHCAYVGQHPYLFRGTVAENLTMRIPGQRLEVERALGWMRQLGLDTCLGPDPMHFVLTEGGSNLSGGQQQRLALVRALHLNHPVLFVDEGTSALDGALRDEVLAVLREKAHRGATVLLVTHDWELAEACDTCLDLALVAPQLAAWNPN